MSEEQTASRPILSDCHILARADDPTADAAQLIRAFSKPYIQRRAAREIIDDLSLHMSYTAKKYIPGAGMLIPVARAGFAMLAGFENTYGYPRVGFVVARKDKVHRSVEISLSAGIDETASSVLILDTIAATGDTLIQLAANLQDRGIEDVSVAIAFASPEALNALKGANRFVNILVGVLGSGVENGWILPRIHGDAGDKLFGQVA